MYLREIGSLGVEWIHLDQTREVLIVLYVKSVIINVTICHCCIQL
jgi:hypothetical protein